MGYVTKDELNNEMREKVPMPVMEELKDNFKNLQSVQLAGEESFTEKISTLRDEYESKTKELVD